jgi:hypothetical protein
MGWAISSCRSISHGAVGFEPIGLVALSLVVWPELIFDHIVHLVFSKLVLEELAAEFEGSVQMLGVDEDILRAGALVDQLPSQIAYVIQIVVCTRAIVSSSFQLLELAVGGVHAFFAK